jgi:hypothetical protein
VLGYGLISGSKFGLASGLQRFQCRTRFVKRLVVEHARVLVNRPGVARHAVKQLARPREAPSA